MGDLVLTDINGPIARLTLNRPARHNSLIPDLLEEMLAGLGDIQANPQVRVVILGANGHSFSTGGDVLGFYEHLDSIESYADRMLGLLNDTIMIMLSLRVPVVAAVHGIVTGGSLGLVLAADIVLVTPETSFTPYYSVVGFSPDGGWTALLPDLIGTKRVAEVLMTNRTITADEAVDWGLANRLVLSKEIHAQALRTAEQLVSMKPESLHSARRLLWRNPDQVKSHLDAERIAFVKQIQSEEARMGMKAFLKK
jgi:2-(1,2-epoxy-1,2-dihydrophenyl)acetyl-CoA isomerase